MKIYCPDCKKEMTAQEGAFVCSNCSFSLKFEEDFLSLVKEKLEALKNELSSLSLSQLKKEILNPQSPATLLLISFIAWGLAYFFRFSVFMVVVTGLGILLGPWGLIIVTVLPLVYKYHQSTIEKEKDEFIAREDTKTKKKKGKDT